MSNTDHFSWPARSMLTFSNKRGAIYFQSKDRDLDLADSLMLNHPRANRTVYMGLSTKSAAWKCWDEISLQEIERRTHYSITFDGYRVTITRLSPVLKRAAPCTDEFRWRLQIRPAI